MWVPCHFLWIPWIYTVTWRPHHGPVQSPDHSRLAHTTKSQGYSIFPRFCQLLPSFHLWIFQNHCSAYASYPQVPLGIYLMSANLPLKHLKGFHHSSSPYPLDPQTLKSQSRLMPLTMHSLLSFQLWLLLATCTLLHSTPGILLPGTQLQCP